MSTKLIFASLFAIGIVAQSFGCPGTLDDEAKYRTDGGTTPGCTDAPTVVFTPKCAISGCHTKADAPASGGLDLESADIGSRTRDVKSKGGAPLLINTASPDQSALYTKLKSPAPFGARMPLGGMQLAQSELDCVLTWVKAEAAKGGPADTGTGSDSGTDTGAASDASDGGG
jgi:hypothetical protein